MKLKILKLFGSALALVFLASIAENAGRVGLGQIPSTYIPSVFAGSAQTRSVLFYMDKALGTDVFGSALRNLGITPQFTQSPAEFASMLSSPWDCVIALHQNLGGSQPFDDPLASYVLRGGRAILVDWRRNEALGKAFGGSYTGSTNLSPITTDTHPIWAGLPASVDLKNPGWSVWSMGLVPIGGSVGTGTFPTGDATVVVGNSGRTLLNGMLSDTFSILSQGVKFAENEIKYCLGQIPPSAGIAIITEGFESGDFSKLPWSVLKTSVVEDSRSLEGYYAAKIDSGGYMEVTLTLSGGMVSFFFYFESTGPELSFYIDGTKMARWRFPQLWSQVTFPFMPGTHTFRWENSGEAYYVLLDQIIWTQFGAPAAAVGVTEQIISRDYAPDGDTKTATVTFAAPIAGGTFDLYLTGDFDDSSECYTLIIEGTKVYDKCDIGFQDEILATTKEGAHFLGTFSLPSSAIGKTSIIVVGKTTADVDYTSPAARDWIIIRASFGAIGLPPSAPALEDFETGNFSKFPWVVSGGVEITSEGDGGSEIPHSGRYMVGFYDEGSLQITLQVNAGAVSFWEMGDGSSDRLRFYIDGTLLGEWQGEGCPGGCDLEDWHRREFPVTAGTHTFRWEGFPGDDDGDSDYFLDDISFPGAAQADNVISGVASDSSGTVWQSPIYYYAECEIPLECWSM